MSQPPKSAKQALEEAKAALEAKSEHPTPGTNTRTVLTDEHRAGLAREKRAREEAEAELAEAAMVAAMQAAAAEEAAAEQERMRLEHEEAERQMAEKIREQRERAEREAERERAGMGRGQAPPTPLFTFGRDQSGTRGALRTPDRRFGTLRTWRRSVGTAPEADDMEVDDPDENTRSRRRRQTAGPSSPKRVKTEPVTGKKKGGAKEKRRTHALGAHEVCDACKRRNLPCTRPTSGFACLDCRRAKVKCQVGQEVMQEATAGSSTGGDLYPSADELDGPIMFRDQPVGGPDDLMWGRWLNHHAVTTVRAGRAIDGMRADIRRFAEAQEALTASNERASMAALIQALVAVRRYADDHPDEPDTYRELEDQYVSLTGETISFGGFRMTPHSSRSPSQPPGIPQDQQEGMGDEERRAGGSEGPGDEERAGRDDGHEGGDEGKDGGAPPDG